MAQREYAYPNGTPRSWDDTAGEADSMLVSMFSPVRVLAEVAAKRRLLELYDGKESLTGRRVGEEYRLGVLDALRLLSEAYGNRRETP